MDQPRLIIALWQISVGIVVQILAISCWFATAAAVPSLTLEFDLDATGRTLLVAAVQAGFALGAVAVGLSRITDRLDPQLLIPVGSLATALVTLLPLLASESLALLVASRVLVGVTLACVYPAGMRATVSWSTPRWRGLAVAGVVAALTLGTAAPHLLEATPVEDWRGVLVACSASATVAALLGLTLRTGSHAARRSSAGDVPTERSERASALTTSPLGSRQQQRITLAYIGHMWEVYGLWVWLPALLLTLPGWIGQQIGLWAFSIVGLAGAVGCVIGGVVASRYGKRVTARWSVGISATCALATPALVALPVAFALVILAVWSASAIADSPLYSAMVGDAAPPQQVGSAIATQMGLGYFLSIGAIALVAALASVVGWQYAFVVLAIGPIASFVALRKPARSQS
ncbi:MFS transporter [Pseudoclavibacter sp. AY1H1]|uniref:MFS transporter n=1 Tax=Pseudoclavibacter sp. AY1H1 TaxID=2080584 RepID=UPI000CE8BCF6|nr:MFS transporter [Pseudoclavibacter sp. AY1H1]PPF36121.1 hypothetical protein C5E05_11585 [Pseudoclavibacter sp. AY1H1]